MAYCDMKAECQSCLQRDAQDAARGPHRFLHALRRRPPCQWRVVCPRWTEIRDAYMGLPPRTRAARGASSRRRPWSSSFRKPTATRTRSRSRSSAVPLRGAVWITPRLEGFGNMSVAFDPISITLYDAQTVVTVAVTVRGDEITRDLTPTVALDVEACDTQAFVAQQATLQLDVLAAAVDDGGTRVSNAGAVVALVVVACVLVAAGLFYCLAAAVRFVRKKQQLEMARALQVRDQVAAAVEKIQEFQSNICNAPRRRVLRAGEARAARGAAKGPRHLRRDRGRRRRETRGSRLRVSQPPVVGVARRRIPRTSTARRCSRPCERSPRPRASLARVASVWVDFISAPSGTGPSSASRSRRCRRSRLYSVRQSNLTLPLVQDSTDRSVRRSSCRTSS